MTEADPTGKRKDLDGSYILGKVCWDIGCLVFMVCNFKPDPVLS